METVGHLLFGSFVKKLPPVFSFLFNNYTTNIITSITSARALVFGDGQWSHFSNFTSFNYHIDGTKLRPQLDKVRPHQVKLTAMIVNGLNMQGHMHIDIVSVQLPTFRV